MDWTTYLRKKRMELQLEDPTSAISDRALASKMLRGAGLSQRERAQVLFNCGGVYDSKRMEVVLKAAYSKVHDSEKRSVFPRRLPLAAAQREHGRPSGSSGGRFPPPPQARRPFALRGRPGHQVHEVENGDNNYENDDDLEEEQHDEDEADDQDDGDPGGGEGIFFEDGAEVDDELGPDDDEPDDEEYEAPEDLQEAFLAGWRAKQKTAAQRQKETRSRCSSAAGPQEDQRQRLLPGRP